VGKPVGKRLLGRPRHREVDDIEIDFRELEWCGVNWIDLAQERDQWRALVNTVIKLRVPKILGNSRVAEKLAASQEKLSSMSDECLFVCH
jgi:hypothetical protein